MKFRIFKRRDNPKDLRTVPQENTREKSNYFSKEEIEILKGYGRALAEYRNKQNYETRRAANELIDSVMDTFISASQRLEKKERGKEPMYAVAHSYISEGYIERVRNNTYFKDRVVNSALYNTGKLALGGALLYLSYKTGGVVDLILKTGSLYAIISSLLTSFNTRNILKKREKDMGYILLSGKSEIIDRKRETFRNADEKKMAENYYNGIVEMIDRKRLKVVPFLIAAVIAALLHLTPVENFVKKQAIKAKIGVENFIEKFNKYYEWGRKI